MNEEETTTPLSSFEKQDQINYIKLKHALNDIDISDLMFELKDYVNERSIPLLNVNSNSMNKDMMRLLETLQEEKLEQINLKN